MTARRRWPILAGLLAVATATLVAADVRVTPLVAEGQVYASFSAADAYTAEVREAVQSGLPTTLTFYVDLRQSALIFWDRTLASVTAAAAVKYDPLRGMFQVSKMTDGQVAWSGSTDREDDVRKWSTEFERIRLSTGDTLEANGEYYVRVRVRATPRRTFFLWPWGRDDAAGRADFTFIR